MIRLWWSLVPVVVAVAVYLRVLRPVAKIKPDGTLWVEHTGPIIFTDHDPGDRYCHADETN